MTKKMIVLGALLVALGAPGWAGAKLGVGGGAAVALGDQFRIAALEMFTELEGHAWLSGRVTLCYLPPLLPAEGPAMLVMAGVRFAPVGAFRPFLALGAGAVVEAKALGGFANHLAGALTVGLEWWITGNLGLYASSSLAVAHRDTPYGKTTYPYLPWAVGFVVASEPRPGALPPGVER